jgi:hypothetical protein
MKARIVIAVLLLLGVVAVSAAPAEAQGRFYVLGKVGYYFPEELDEDISYGVGFGGQIGEGNWGWEVSGEWFDVEDTQGGTTLPIQFDLFHVDFSAVVHPGGGPFNFFFGPGFATAEIQFDDAVGGNQELSDDVFTAHVGLGWDINLSDNVFFPLEARARFYELEGLGRDGGKQSQVDYEASAGVGFRF